MHERMHLFSFHVVLSIFLSSLNKIVQELVLILVIVLNRLMIEMVFMW